MENKKLSELTNEELLIKKKKLKTSKTINALMIGFLAGIVAIGIVALSILRKMSWDFFRCCSLFSLFTNW